MKIIQTIASVASICFCVDEQCEGPITRHPDPPTDAKTAAKFYRLAADSFRDYFGEVKR